ncbi:uncharacterized protein LOC141913019 [Tubulanus polymorphus]|uniref:uncharacterized protein LOC141913019 n=1 Tax=Tubulanus polymorphus TaxID=672921 RepID=UPI003DA67870
MTQIEYKDACYFTQVFVEKLRLLGEISTARADTSLEMDVDFLRSLILVIISVSVVDSNLYSPCGNYPFVRNSAGAEIIADCDVADRFMEVKYTCQDGYTLRDDVDTIKCDENTGRWSPKPACCKDGITDCISRRSISNGYRASHTDKTCGGSVNYACSDSYRLFGNHLVTCEYEADTNTNVWSNRPFCIQNADKMQLTPSRYVAYIKGDSRLMLTKKSQYPIKISRVPHGGYIRADEITPRVEAACLDSSDNCQYIEGCSNPESDSVCKKRKILSDSCTMEITFDVAHYLKEDFNISATVVAILMHRSRLDANRYPDEGPYEHEREAAKKAFEEYADIIKSMINTTPDKSGLLLDVHGHAQNSWLQLGYTISSSELSSSSPDPNKSSIRNLFGKYNSKTGRDFKSLLIGDKSFGHYLQQENTPVDSIPSPKYPTQESDDNKRTYTLTGGYTTQRYGRDHPTFSAIQLEFPKSVRDSSNDCKDTDNYRRKVSAAIAAFYKYHYE